MNPQLVQSVFQDHHQKNSSFKELPEDNSFCDFEYNNNIINQSTFFFNEDSMISQLKYDQNILDFDSQQQSPLKEINLNSLEQVSDQSTNNQSDLKQQKFLISLEEEEENSEGITNEQTLIPSEIPIKNSSEKYLCVSNENKKIRIRKKMERKLPGSNEKMQVKDKTSTQRKQFKNHFKLILKKMAQYLQYKLRDSPFIEDEKLVMVKTLKTYEKKIKKIDALFLIRNFEDLLNKSEDEFNIFLALQQDGLEDDEKEMQKSNPQYRAFKYIQSLMENSSSYSQYREIVRIINNLNKFNRTHLPQYLQFEYNDILLYAKAEKTEQFFTKNYILLSLSNPNIIE